MGKRPSRFERMIIKLIVFHFLLLLIAQLLLANGKLSLYLNKTFLYEGVDQQTETKIMETLDR